MPASAPPRQPRRTRKSKSKGVPCVRGELRDLPPAKSVAESHAEWQAFFAKAWAQKGARERGEAAGVPKKQVTFAATSAEPSAVSKERAERERLQRISRALNDSDSD